MTTVATSVGGATHDDSGGLHHPRRLRLVGVGRAVAMIARLCSWLWWHLWLRWRGRYVVPLTPHMKTLYGPSDEQVATLIARLSREKP